MTFDPYLDLDHGVLRNKLGITDPAELARAEAELVALRQYELHTSRLEGRYDLVHLQALHLWLFQDVYDWAGRIRTVTIGKNGQMFCMPQNIHAFAGTIFGWLTDTGHLRGRTRPQFLAGATTLLAHICELHPFREGNGRTQRVFLTQLARDAGYRIRWIDMDPAQNVAASRASLDGDNDPLRAMLDTLVDRIEPAP
ncbi:Fic family protein [Actinomycetes bacterium KLBMP 9759]